MTMPTSSPASPKRGVSVNKITQNSAPAYAVASNDYMIRCDATANNQVISLPTAASAFITASSSGQQFIVKKVDASANTITVQCHGSELLDGYNSLTISAQYSGNILQSNGTSWDVIASTS